MIPHSRMPTPIGEDQASILIVEDELAQREALSAYLRGRGHDVTAVSSAEEAIELLRRRAFSVLITDLRLPGMDGLELLKQAHAMDDGLCTLLTTAFASVESAVEALRCNAHDYILKPLILEEVTRKVNVLLEHQALRRENARLRHVLSRSMDDSPIVSTSESMKQVLEWVRRAAASSVNVLLTGETGTGKELVARAIHQASDRREQPFLPVNLAAIPLETAESELFGHEKGAFTGADSKREGVLRAAGSGTVLLDEVAELDPSIQAKLLRALESGEVRPLGSDVCTPVQARILAATHKTLEEEISEGRFREDLYYRLNVIRIHIPPLRERRDDIPDLVHHMLERNLRSGASPLGYPSVEADAMRALCAHSWRGNVRELRNILERATILADEGVIRLEHLPSDVQESGSEGLDLQEAVDRFERNHIASVLRLTQNEKDEAARVLGISTATLYRRIEKLGLKRDT